jgi:hypothetical protein
VSALIPEKRAELRTLQRECERLRCDPAPTPEWGAYCRALWRLQEELDEESVGALLDEVEELQSELFETRSQLTAVREREKTMLVLLDVQSRLDEFDREGYDARNQALVDRELDEERADEEWNARNNGGSP